jgi:hypothetical protein
MSSPAKEKETSPKVMFILHRLSEFALAVDGALIVYNLMTGDVARAWSHSQYALWWIIVRWHWL